MQTSEKKLLNQQKKWDLLAIQIFTDLGKEIKNSLFGKYAYISRLGRMKIRTNLLKVYFTCQ